jgi:steroid delta-isomerase-like uncharacterized protein
VFEATRTIATPLQLVLQFIEHINKKDLEALVGMMATDHRFVDATGEAHTGGKDAMRTAWTRYFESFPDYRIEVEEAFGNDATGAVATFGFASGSFAGTSSDIGSASWRIPAAWHGNVRDGLIAEWRVFCDVEPMLRSMGIDRFERARRHLPVFDAET